MATHAAKTASRPKGLETAKRVRKAALKRFANAGYAAVSMREIAADVGVRPGALYNHFPTKQDILKDLMLSHMSELLAAWEMADVPDAMDPLERFVRFHIAITWNAPTKSSSPTWSFAIWSRKTSRSLNASAAATKPS